MDMLLNIFDIDYFKGTLIAVTGSIIFSLITLIRQSRYTLNNQYMHKIKYQSIFSPLYIPISTLIEMTIFIFLYIFIATIAFYFFPSSSIIVTLLSNNIIFYSCLLIISALSSYICYKCKYSEVFNIKKKIVATYFFLPFFIFIATALANFNMLFIVLYIPIFLIAFFLQPRIDKFVYNKMDIMLNDGRYYKQLSPKNVNFNEKYCTITIFYKKCNPNTVMNKLLIQNTAITSIRYYDAEHRLDPFYKILLKHFSSIFIDFEKEKSGNI